MEMMSCFALKLKESGLLIQKNLEKLMIHYLLALLSI